MASEPDHTDVILLEKIRSASDRGRLKISFNERRYFAKIENYVALFEKVDYPAGVTAIVFIGVAMPLVAMALATIAWTIPDTRPYLGELMKYIPRRYGGNHNLPEEWIGLGVIALAAFGYGWLVMRRRRRLFLSRLELWDRLWHSGVLKIQTKSEKRTCESPDGDWRAFANSLTV